MRPIVSGSFESWSHGAQASWDQSHAKAVEKLREADTFIVAALKSDEAEPDLFIFSATCVSDKHLLFLLQLLAGGMPGMLERIVAGGEA